MTEEEKLKSQKFQTDWEKNRIDKVIPKTKYSANDSLIHMTIPSLFPAREVFNFFSSAHTCTHAS